MLIFVSSVKCFKILTRSITLHKRHEKTPPPFRSITSSKHVTCLTQDFTQDVTQDFFIPSKKEDSNRKLIRILVILLPVYAIFMYNNLCTHWILLLLMFVASSVFFLSTQFNSKRLLKSTKNTGLYAEVTCKRLHIYS